MACEAALVVFIDPMQPAAAAAYRPSSDIHVIHEVCCGPFTFRVQVADFLGLPVQQLTWALVPLMLPSLCLAESRPISQRDAGSSISADGLDAIPDAVLQRMLGCLMSFLQRAHAAYGNYAYWTPADALAGMPVAFRTTAVTVYACLSAQQLMCRRTGTLDLMTWLQLLPQACDVALLQALFERSSHCSPEDAELPVRACLHVHLWVNMAPMLQRIARALPHVEGLCSLTVSTRQNDMLPSYQHGPLCDGLRSLLHAVAVRPRGQSIKGLALHALPESFVDTALAAVPRLCDLQALVLCKMTVGVEQCSKAADTFSRLRAVYLLRCSLRPSHVVLLQPLANRGVCVTILQRIHKADSACWRKAPVSQLEGPQGFEAVRLLTPHELPCAIGGTSGVCCMRQRDQGQPESESEPDACFVPPPWSSFSAATCRLQGTRSYAVPFTIVSLLFAVGLLVAGHICDLMEQPACGAPQHAYAWLQPHAFGLLLTTCRSVLTPLGALWLLCGVAWALQIVIDAWQGRNLMSDHEVLVSVQPAASSK